jgi:ADP-heptose:LPS heptosyltransferase
MRGFAAGPEATDHIGRVREPSIEAAVVIFPGALGDLLLALPALRVLRARHAAARLTVVVTEPLRALVGHAGVADETATLDGAATAALFGGGAPAPAWLADRPVVYSWLGADDAEFRARVAACARTAHFRRVERGAATTHASVAYVRAVGQPTTVRSLAASGPLAAPRSVAADELLGRTAGPVLALHPGAGARAKRWDLAGFVHLAHWWRAAGGAVVSITGPAEAGEPPALGLPEVREWRLLDLAAVLARSALYVGNDSGVSHLAGAVGAAGAVLYGPTDPRRWRPLGGDLVSLHARASGPDGIPLSALPVARVIAACRRRFALTREDPRQINRGCLPSKEA